MAVCVHAWVTSIDIYCCVFVSKYLAILLLHYYGYMCLVWKQVGVVFFLVETIPRRELVLSWRMPLYDIHNPITCTYIILCYKNTLLTLQSMQ